MRVAVVTFLSLRLQRSTNRLWLPNSAATTCLDSASRRPVCTLAYGPRGLQARQALKPKPVALPPVPEEVLKPDFNRRFEPLPHSPPVKLKGQITNGNNLKP